MKEKRLRPAGVAVLIILMLLVVFGIVFLLKTLLLNGDHNTPVKPDEPVKPEDKVDYKISVKDYEIYSSTDLDFDFVIARLRFEDPSNHYEIKNFKTSDGVILNDVKEYVDKIEELGYYLGLKNVVFNLPVTNDAFESTIFFPVKGESTTLNYLDQTIGIDLSKSRADIEYLKYEITDVITDNDSYEIKITNVTNLSGDIILHNGEEYTGPSTTQLYALLLHVDLIGDGDLVIEDAYFVSGKNGEKYQALDDGYENLKHQNLFDYKITDTCDGALMFELFNPYYDNQIIYIGKLYLKLNVEDNYIILDLNLN